MTPKLSEAAVLGLDIGGTSSRCAVVDLGGHLLSRTRGAGASVLSSQEPTNALLEVVGDALQLARGARIVGCVVGAAAGGAGHRPLVERMVGEVTTRLGVDAPLEVVTDIESAFASASTRPKGLILLAGTGSVAAAIDDFQVVARLDGHGWWFGDRGSGVWIGVAIVKAVLAELDGAGPRTALTSEVIRQWGLERVTDPRQSLIAYAYSLTPSQLGELAPIASSLAETDSQAQRILEQAASELLATLAPLLDRYPSRELVIGGSVLLAAGPLRSHLLSGVGERPILEARDGELGAAALALLRAGSGLVEHDLLLKAAE